MVPEGLLDLLAQGRLILGFASAPWEEVGVGLWQKKAAPLRDVALDPCGRGLCQQEVEGLAVLDLRCGDDEAQPPILSPTLPDEVLVKPQVVEVLNPHRRELKDLDRHGRLDQKIRLLP